MVIGFTVLMLVVGLEAFNFSLIFSSRAEQAELNKASWAELNAAQGEV